MARIRIELPQHRLGSFLIPVRITDINYGQHVGNHAFVELIHEARVQWLQSHGYTELEVAGTSLIMNELVVEYKQESFYRDVPEITLFGGEVSTIGFELFYQITVTRDSISHTLALAKTGMVCYNYLKKKIETVPGDLRKLLMEN